jgi:hypothetical protein
MSIILKGIDLPKGNDLIEVLIDKDGYTMVNVKPNSILLGEGRTQAIQIPTPHGRLIDMRALFEDLNKYQIEYNADINKVISDAPTVLEAEEE